MSKMEMQIEDNSFFERATEKLGYEYDKLTPPGVIFHDTFNGIDIMIRRTSFYSSYSGKTVGGKGIVMTATISNPLEPRRYSLKKRINIPTTKNVISSLKKTIATLLDKKACLSLAEKIDKEAAKFHENEDFQRACDEFALASKPYIDMSYEELLQAKVWLNNWISNNKSVDTNGSK